jgi:hypothetical protein
MALTTTIISEIRTSHTNPIDLESPSSDMTKRDQYSLASGVGASQADRKFTDQRTLAPSANEDLDLAGSLVDAFGAVITFVKIKAIKVKAAAANVNNVVVKPGAANGFLGPFGAATHTITIPPNGELLLLAPVAGWTVTAGTGDLFNVANSGAGTSVTYDIVIVGTSA